MEIASIIVQEKSVKTLLNFSVTALNFSVVARRIGPDSFVMYA